MLVVDMGDNMAGNDNCLTEEADKGLEAPVDQQTPGGKDGRRDIV